MSAVTIELVSPRPVPVEELRSLLEVGARVSEGMMSSGLLPERIVVRLEASPEFQEGICIVAHTRTSCASGRISLSNHGPGMRSYRHRELEDVVSRDILPLLRAG